MFKRNIFLVILISSFLVLFFICSMAEATIYVNGALSSSSEDGSRDNPYLTIQKGIRNAGSGDTVLVAYAHTYRERIELKSGVRVIGGATIDGSATGGPVVTAIGVDRALFQGFRIVGGDSTRGGGMYIEDSSLTVMFCDFEDNFASVHGGGIYMINSSPSLQYCSFTGNHAGDLGGGIHCQLSDPDIYGCDFEDNIADDGGGMAIYHSSATVANCNFEYNRAPYLYGNGGGIYVSTSDTSTPSTIENSLFKGNYSRTNGGGIYVSSPYSVLDVVNCTFWQNEAYQRGAGVYCLRTASNVINCTFYDNYADYGGGAIYNIGSFSSRINMSVVNSIFWANGDSPIAGTRLPNVTYSDVEDGYGGTGNINTIPLFINPTGGDFRLRGDSPCIDAGDSSHPLLPSNDFEGDSRILDGDGVEGPIVDMGVDEYNRFPYFYLPFSWSY